MEENINNYISDDNTYLGKLVHYWDTKGLPKKKINIILKDGITVTAYVVVPVLPPISQAEEGVFYILPDDSLNYVAGGHWHSIQPDGEDNVIEIIRDSNGVPLPVNPFDKSVTLPIDTTYTFEEMFVNSTRVGWRVRENGGAVIFTHNDVNDQSDKVVQITPILNKEAVGDETELNVSDVSDLKQETFSPNETVVYDTNGTMAVIASVDWTTNKAIAKTVSWVDPSDGVYYTTVELNTDVRSTTNLTVNDTTITDRKDIVEGETLLYDLKGTVAVITAAAGVNLIATTITNTDAAQSDGTYKCSVALNDTIDGTEVVSITNVPDLPNIQQAVINETLLYDIDGRVAKVTAINDVDDELTVKTITKVGYGAYVWYYDSTDNLALYVSETKNIEKDAIVRIDNLSTHITTKDVVFGKTFVTDKNGTVGVIINYDSSHDEYVIKTVAANTNPLILKAENKLSDQVGQSVTLPKSDLTCFTPSWVVDDTEIQWNKSLVFDTVRAAIGIVNDIYAGNNYKITTIYSADAPFVFETTNFTLPDLGQETADLTIVSEKAKFKRVDDNTQLLEEYAIIPGKTTIYARNEGKIGVVSALDSTYGTFKIKTVYEGKSGSIHRMNGFVGVCPNRQDEFVTYPRNRLYTNVSDMVIDKDIWYDTEGNLAVLGSYDSTNDTVTLHGIHSTYPQTHYLITSDTLLNTAIGGEATVTDIDVPNMRHDSTFRAYAWTVSDKNGVLGIVTAKTGSAAPYTYTVKTISTASSDSTLWRWLPTGGATYLPQNMMVRLSRADLLASSDVDLNKLVSGKSLIVDANVGVIATITEVIPTGETDPVYDLTPIFSSPQLDPYFVPTAKLNTKTSGTIAVSQTSLNTLYYNPYRTYLRDTDGTIAVVTNVDVNAQTYSYTPLVNGRQDIFLLDTYTTPKNVGETTTAMVSNVKYFDNAGQAASGTITGEMLRGRIDNAVLFDKSGNLWSIVDIASNNNTMTIKKLAGDAKQVMVWILSNTNKKLPTGIGTAFVLTYEDLSFDHTSAEDLGLVYPGQLVYDIDGTLAKITSVDTNNNQIQVLTITNSNTSPAFVVNIPEHDPDDHTYIPMSERVFTYPGDIIRTKYSYLDNLANVTPSIDTVRIGETIVYDGFGGVGIVEDFDITNNELGIWVISVPTHEQTILNLDGKLNGIKLGDIYRLELDHQHLPQWLNGDHFGWMEYPYFDDMVGRIFGWDETNNVFCLLVDAQREWEGVYDPYDESWLDFEAIGGGSMGVWKIKNDSQFSNYPDGSASRTIGAIAIEGYDSADPSTYPRLNDLVFDLLGNVWRITNITTPVTGRYLTLTPIGSDRLALRFSGVDGLSQNGTASWGETKAAVDMSPLRWADGGMVVTSPNKNIVGYYVTDRYGDMAVVIGCNTTNNTFNYVMISGGRHFGASYERNNTRKGYSPVVDANGEMKVGQSIELRDNDREDPGIGTGTLEMKSETTTGNLFWNPDSTVYSNQGYTGNNRLLGTESGGVTLYGRDDGVKSVVSGTNINSADYMRVGSYYGINDSNDPITNCPVEGEFTMMVYSLDTDSSTQPPYSTTPRTTVRFVIGHDGSIKKQRCVWDYVSGTRQWTFGDWEELGGGGTGIHYVTAGYRIGPEKIIGNSVTTPISWLHDYVAGKQFVKVGELVADKTGVTTLVTSVNYALATPTFTGTVISTYPHKLEYRHDEGLRKNGTLALGDESSDSHDLRYLTDFFGQQVIDTVSTISWLVGYHVTDWAGDEAIITATNDTANTFSAKIISGGGKITGYSRTKYSPVVDSTGTMAIGTKIGFKDNNVGVPAGTGELYINNINAGNLKFSHNASFYPNTWDDNKLLGTQSGGITLIGQDDGAIEVDFSHTTINHGEYTKVGNYYGVNTDGEGGGIADCPAEVDEMFTMQVQGLDTQTNDDYRNVGGPSDSDRTRIRYLQTEAGILWKQVITWDHTNGVWTYGTWTKIGGGITAVDHTGTYPVLTDLIYPVGSEYTSYTLSTPQDVAAYLGGTWVAVPNGLETIAWYKEAAGTVTTSYNLTATKNATGKYTLTFGTPLPDLGYVVSVASANAIQQINSQTVNGFEVWTYDGNPSLQNWSAPNITVQYAPSYWKYKRTA